MLVFAPNIDVVLVAGVLKRLVLFGVFRLLAPKGVALLWELLLNKESPLAVDVLVLNGVPIWKGDALAVVVAGLFKVLNMPEPDVLLSSKPVFCCVLNRLFEPNALVGLFVEPKMDVFAPNAWG